MGKSKGSSRFRPELHILVAAETAALADPPRVPFPSVAYAFAPVSIKRSASLRIPSSRAAFAAPS